MVPMGRAGLCVGLAIAALLVGGCGVAAPGDARTGARPRPRHRRRSSTTPAPQASAPGGDDSLTSSYGPAVPADAAPHRRHRRLRRPHRARGQRPRPRRDALGARPRLHPGRAAAAPARDAARDPAARRAGRRTCRPTGSHRVDPDAVTESDPITISVTDHQARDIDLSDPSLGEIAGLVGTLVSDVTLSVPATTRCTTPTTARRRAGSLSAGRATRTRSVCRGADPAAYRPLVVRVLQGCSRSPACSCRAQKFVATSSMTKLVWSEESSLAANFSVTFVPL